MTDSTPSSLAKSCGLDSLKELSEISGTSLSSLNWLFKNNMKKFKCLAYGAAIMQKTTDDQG